MRLPTISVMLDNGAYLPEKAHAADAGYDLRTPADATIYPGGTLTIDTGVHMLIPDGYVGMIKSKSGLNVRDGIISEGVVDAGYTGSIRVKLRADADAKPKTLFITLYIREKIHIKRCKKYFHIFQTGRKEKT